MRHAHDLVGTRRAARVIEIVGPAGAGKTTLSGLLARAQPNTQVGLRLRIWRLLPFTLLGAAASLPAILAATGPGHGLSRRTALRMVYLQAHLRTVQQYAAARPSLLVLDQGPVYKLAELCEFDPAAYRGSRLEPWWEQMVREWAGVLDLVICLDAADEVLMQRIEIRAKVHPIKQADTAEARTYLTRYRAAVQEIIGQLAAKGGPAWIQLRTDQQAPDQIAQQSLAALELPPRCQAVPNTRPAFHPIR